MDAFRYYSKEAALIDAVSKDLKVPSDDLPGRIASLTEKLKQAEREIAKLHQEQLQAKSAEFVAQAQDINGFKVLTLNLPNGVAANDLRTLATDLRNRLSNDDAIVVLASENDGKLPFIAAATKSARSEEHTSELQSRGHLVCRLLLEIKNL